MIVNIDGVGRFRIRSMTEGERGTIEASVLYADDRAAAAKLLKPRLICACLVDDDGDRIFSDADLDAITGLDSSVTSALADAIEQHCGIKQADIEELEGN